MRAYRHDTHGWNLLWKGTVAMFLSSSVEFVLVCLLAYPGLTLRRAPRPLTSLRHRACCGQKSLFSSKTRGIPHVRDHMQPGWPSHSRTNGEKHSLQHGLLAIYAFLASWQKTVQSRKALLPMYLSEGGKASSTRAAQFMKALTRSVWRVVGRRTSLRLVQCTKANSGISSTLVLQRSTLSSSLQLSHACAPIATKCFVRASAVIPAELQSL